MPQTGGCASGQSNTGLRLILGAVCLALFVVATPSGSGATEPAGAWLDVRDAHIEGSGPWTSLFGARSERTLVLTVVNTGDTAIDVPPMTLAFGRAADPDQPLTSPAVGGLAPGAAATVRVALTLPRFAIGTYAVTGSIPGTDPPVTFRSETSHIPWALVLAPALVLVQLALVAVRNRVRRRIHGAPTPSRPDPTPVESVVAPSKTAGALTRIITEELAIVFDDAAASRLHAASDSDRVEMIRDLTATTAARVADRAGVDGATRRLLDTEIAHAVFDALGVADS